MLKVKNLKKYFGGVKAVDGCNFKVEKGKITALIGPNGSGKTTVFNLISGIVKPDFGEIIFCDHELSNKKIHQISNFGLSRVFQQSRLFKNLSVMDNLLIAVNNQDTKFWRNLFGYNQVSQKKKNLVKKILLDLGISKIKNQLAGELSFGQKRLVELARAILNPHQLLILDEPVAGVNPKLRNEISQILLGLKKEGETILLIEHDMSFTLSLADHIIVMDAGKVIAEGKPKEIKNNPIVLEAYLGD